MQVSPEIFTLPNVIIGGALSAIGIMVKQVLNRQKSTDAAVAKYATEITKVTQWAFGPQEDNGARSELSKVRDDVDELMGKKFSRRASDLT